MFHMKGASLLKIALQHLPPFLEKLQPGLSSGTGDIDRFFPHQASQKGKELLIRLGWPSHKMESTLSKTGNLVAASVPMALYQAIKENRLHRGDKIVLFATGAGFSLGGIILRY